MIFSYVQIIGFAHMKKSKNWSMFSLLNLGEVMDCTCKTQLFPPTLWEQHMHRAGTVFP